jgi:predicted nucleotidyltransferase
MVVSIPERKARRAQQLRAAARSAMAELRAYAADRSGRFLVFGSAARDDMQYDSDFDVVVDFPAGSERAARDHVEFICQRFGLTPDVHLVSEASPALMSRVHRDAVALP